MQRPILKSEIDYFWWLSLDVAISNEVFVWGKILINHRTFSLTDQGGVPSARPLRVQILSFCHTKFSKRDRLVSSCPPRGPRPPMGNPGSATAFNGTCSITWFLPNAMTLYNVHWCHPFVTLTCPLLCESRKNVSTRTQ